MQGVREWLSNCPFIIIEKVIDLTLQQIEQDIVEDKDRKLILTLINIERLKPSDLCFGFHALLDVISDVELPLTKFSPSFKWGWKPMLKDMLINGSVVCFQTDLLSVGIQPNYELGLLNRQVVWNRSTPLFVTHIVPGTLGHGQNLVSACIHHTTKISNDKMTDPQLLCLHTPAGIAGPRS